jgi:hypothetical protein
VLEKLFQSRPVAGLGEKDENGFVSRRKLHGVHA